MNIATNPDLAVRALQEGEFAVLLDHPEREGEADLLLAAQFATGEKVNEMVNVGRGLITLAVAAERLAQLGIPLIQPANCGPNWPHLAEPIDYRLGTTTGASAFDRAATAKAVADPASRPQDFARPGHLLPISAAAGGLRERSGHTEGAIALALAADLFPAVLMCEMMDSEGHMARGVQLKELLRRAGLPVVTVEELAERR